MNGDENTILHKIEHRLTILETQTKEKWNSHDKRSDEIWIDIKQTMTDFGKKLDSFPKNKEHCMKSANSYANKIVSLAIGVPTTIFILYKIAEGMTK